MKDTQEADEVAVADVVGADAAVDDAAAVDAAAVAEGNERKHSSMSTT